MIIRNRPHPAHPEDGVQIVHKYDNGYGASVVRTPYSYGGDKGLWEVAVVIFTDMTEGEEAWVLTYDTPVTSDVIGHLDDVDLDEVLRDIEALEPAHW